MTIIAKFYAGGNVYNILRSETGFWQASDDTGRSNQRSFFKGLHMVIEATRDNFFFDMAVHPNRMEQGRLEYIPAIPGGRPIVRYFADFVVLEHYTNFDANSNYPVTETVLISAGGVKDGVFGTEHSNYWQRSRFPRISQPVIVEEEEERPKKCRIGFKAASSDLKEGHFGFDAYTPSLDRNCESNGIGGRTTTYKDSYRSIQVEGEDYRVPKMSLRINRTITLELDKTMHREEEYEDISFVTPAGFSITPVDNRGNPVDVIGARKVHITCTTHGSADTPTTIQILADGTIAGAIDVWHPKPKTITVKTVIVEAKGGITNTDVSKLANKTTQAKLDQYFKAVLGPALIDVQLVDTTPEVLDLTAITEDDTMKQYYLQKMKNAMITGSTHRIKFTQEHKDLFFNSLGQLYKVSRTQAGQFLDPSHLILIFTNMECTKEGDLNSYTNGTTKQGISVMFMANERIKPHQEIPHEIMHGAGLPHPFKENLEKDGSKTHIFRQGSTDNYMDYDNEHKRKHLWHWQWQKLYNSHYAK